MVFKPLKWLWFFQAGFDNFLYFFTTMRFFLNFSLDRVSYGVYVTRNTERSRPKADSQAEDRSAGQSTGTRNKDARLSALDHGYGIRAYHDRVIEEASAIGSALHAIMAGLAVFFQNHPLLMVICSYIIATL